MDVISEKMRTARKPHLCEDCGRSIGAGETYRIQALKDYGDFWTWRSCQHCSVIAKWVFANLNLLAGEDGLVVRPYVEEMRHEHPVLGVLAPLVAAGYSQDGRLLTALELELAIAAADEPALV